MLKRICGGAMLMFALVLVGCSSGPSAPEDKIMVEKVAILEKIAGLFEKVNDKQSFEAMSPQMQPLNERLTKLNEEFEALPPETKTAATEKHSGAIEQAMARMKTAKTAAAEKAFGAKGG